VRVQDVGVKEALIAEDPGVYFTTPHFDGYPAVLVQLERIGADRVLVFYRRTCVRELNLQKRQSYPVYFSREERVFED